MDKLAEVAGVSKRTVYNHFATKEALVMTLMTDLWEQALSQPTVAYDAHQPLEAQLQQLVRWLDPAKQPRYVVMPRQVYQWLQQAWQLPELPPSL